MARAAGPLPKTSTSQVSSCFEEVEERLIDLFVTAAYCRSDVNDIRLLSRNGSGDE